MSTLNAVNPTPVLFLSDLDGTWLSKNPAARKILDTGIQVLKDEFSSRGVDLQFGYVTARPPGRVEKENLPQADWTLTYNGGYIHQGQPGAFTPDYDFQLNPPLQKWQEANLATGFQASIAASGVQHLLTMPQYQNLKMETVGQVVKDSEADACPAVATFCFKQDSIALTADEKVDGNGDGTPDLLEKESFQPPQQIQHFAEELSQYLKDQKVQFNLSPVYQFHGEPYLMFDVASPLANKGQAVEFLRNHVGVRPDHVIVAGDGGNDIAMMKDPDGLDDGRRTIVVGGGKALTEQAGRLQHSEIRRSDEDCSIGVLKALHLHLVEITGEDD